MITWLMVDKVRGLKVRREGGREGGRKRCHKETARSLRIVHLPPSLPSSLQPTVTGACVGAVVGLVTITPACGFVDVGGSFVIGIVRIRALPLSLPPSLPSSSLLRSDTFPVYSEGRSDLQNNQHSHAVPAGC